jgi:hypothetical protein
MKSRLLAASFAAVLVIASGITGSFYFAGAQVQRQSSSDGPQISLDNEGAVELGSSTTVSGGGFDPDAELSLYLKPAVIANFTDSEWVILQRSEGQTIETDGDGRNLLSDAFDTLRGLLDMQAENQSLDTNSTGRLFVVPDGEFTNGEVTLECDDQEIASGNPDSNSSYFSLEAIAGEYRECSLTTSDEDGIVDSASLGRMKIVSNPDEEFNESPAATVRSDNAGDFSAAVTISKIESGQYAFLAIANDGKQTAVSEVFTAAENTATQSQDADNNETATQNDGIPSSAAENTTSQQPNETPASNDTGEAEVQVDQEVEQGSPLAIQGDGFEPNTPVQVFINDIQITNVITNIEGSFNSVVIVPTVVSNGNAEVVVKTEQTNVVRNVQVIPQDNENTGPASIRFSAISAADDARRLEGAPVTIFDTRTGKLVESDRTPFTLQLEKGKYSVFYSDFRDFEFESARPGTWIDTPGGGSGLLTVREGKNATVTATYNEVPSPPPQTPATSTIVLRAQDTDGNALEGMFVSVYDAETGDTVEQGFTELRISDLSAGTFPVFFANFGQRTFVSATPGSWVQTPYGGAGLVVIPADGTSHEVAVTATYDQTTAVAEDQSDIQAPLDLRGHVFSITSNETRPEGPFVISGTMTLTVESEDPARATLTASLMSAREDSNQNVDLDSQRSRDHDTFHIVDFKTENAAPTGLTSYIVTGTADLLLNGDMYSNDEDVQVIVRGGEELTPTIVEIQFQGEHRYSAANRLETLHAVVTDGFQ